MSRGKRFFRSSIVALMFAGDLDRVGAGNLEDGDDGGRLAVVAADRVVEHRPELDAGDVLDADLRAVRVGPEDDVAEFLIVEQPALRLDRVGVLGAAGGRRTADLTGRGQLVLRVDRVDDVGDGEAEAPDPIGTQPDPHRVVAAAEQVDLADARNARDRVVDVDRRVVRQEVVVVGAVRRLHRDDQEWKRQRLLHRDAVVLHRLRHLRLASDTRFCVNTLSMSWFDPTSKETFSVNVPSLALVDFM